MATPRGEMTLAFGPMKPVGLTDPVTGRRPFAVVQLRAEDSASTAYNLVGFQTRMTYPEQKRVFRMIPGLEECEIQPFRERTTGTRSSTRHRVPRRADAASRRPNVFIAGQISGVEGYVERDAGSFLCARSLLAQSSPRPHGHAATP